MNDANREKQKYLKKNLSYCYFVYHKFYLDRLRVETGLSR